MKKATQNRLEKQIEQKVDKELHRLQGDYEQQARIAQAELEQKKQAATTVQETEQANAEYKAIMDDALQSLVDGVQKR